MAMATFTMGIDKQAVNLAIKYEYSVFEIIRMLHDYYLVSGKYSWVAFELSCLKSK